MPPAVARLLDDAIAAGLGSGAALAVASPHGVWRHDAGLTARVRRDVQGALQPWPGTPVGRNTLFDLASLTKPFVTSTLLAQTLSRPDCALDLQDRLARWLPQAQGTVLGEATLGQLCSHTSGAPPWLDFAAATYGCTSAEREREIMRLVLDTPHQHPPGQQAVYSDLGYMALGWLLESVLGAPLDVLFSERIAAPAGVAAGYRRLSQPQPVVDVMATEIWPRRCPDGLPLQGAVHDDNAAALDGVAGHAGLFANADAVLRLAQAWLAAWLTADDRPHGPLQLKPSLVRWLASTPGVPADREGKRTTWHHGWDTPSRPGSTAGDLVPEDAFGHLGFTGTSVWLAPSLEAVVVLLTNRVHPDRAPTEGIRNLRRHVHDGLWQLLGSDLATGNRSRSASPVR